MSQARRFQDELPLIHNCPAFNELRLAEELTDVIIEVQGGAQIQAHKLILAARLPGLRACDNGPLRKDTTVLRWPTVHLSQATSLIQYAYTGELEITQDNALGILGLARTVQLRMLENWAIKVLANTVSPENLETTWNLANFFENTPLTNACLWRMAAHFESFVYSDLFTCLPADTILTLLRSDHLVVSSEEQIFAAISRWAGASNEVEDAKMKLHAPSMLKEIQWAQTTVQFRDRLLRSNPIFLESAEYLYTPYGFDYELDKRCGKVHLPCPFNERMRPPLAFFLFGLDNIQQKFCVLQFDAQLEIEQRIADMEARLLATYSVVAESIFVVGGRTRQQWRTTSVEEFLVHERRWRTRAPLSGRREAHSAAVLWVDAATVDNVGAQAAGEKALIGVFGGDYKEGDTWTVLASCELYDLSQGRWHRLPDLPQQRSGSAAVCMHGDSRIFVFGGFDGSSQLDSVVYCRLRADWLEKATTTSSAAFWLPAASMRNARSHLAAVTFRGKILVAGGNNSTGEEVNAVELFSPPDADCPRGQWTEVAGMVQPRCTFYFLTSGEAVFALGNGRRRQNTVEVFTAPTGSVDMNNDFRAWTCSLKGPVESLANIRGASSLRI